jgi:hypothetical protein
LNAYRERHAGDESEPGISEGARLGDLEWRNRELEVPDFRGMQAVNDWLFGHDRGLLFARPDTDSSQPLLHGAVVDQAPLRRPVP